MCDLLLQKAAHFSILTEKFLELREKTEAVL